MRKSTKSVAPGPAVSIYTEKRGKVMFLPLPKRLKPLLRFLVAIALPLASLVVRRMLESVLGARAPFETFYPAVVLSAWAGGLWPGIVTTLGSFLLVLFFIVPPKFSMYVTDPRDLLTAGLFLLSGVFASYLFEALRDATERSFRSAVRADANARAARAVREREKYILEGISDGFIAFDPQWRVTFANACAAKMLRHEREEIVGENIESLYPSGVLSNARIALRKAVEEKSPVHFDFHDETHDRWLGASAYPSRAGVSLFLRDITVSRRLEQALRESEERFRTMADSAPLMIWTSSPEGSRDYVNRVFLEFSGREYEDEVGDGWEALIFPEDRERVRATYRTARKTRLAFTIEYRMRRAAGDYRWILESGAPRADEVSGNPGWVGSGLDITDRKVAEEALREREEQLRLSIAVSQIGAWREDPISRRFFWSPEMERIMGYAPGTCPDTPEFVTGIIHPEDRPHVRGVLARATKQGTEYETEFRFYRPDGDLRWLFVRGQAFLDESRKCTKRTGVGIDVTERKRFDERVRHAQKLESLGILAGGIAHDFNNLLTGIMGSASLVLEELQPQSFAWTMQRNALDASKRAAQLTNQMLAYAGKGRFHIELLDLRELVCANLRLIEASIHNKKIELRLDLAETPCGIEGDPAQMQQVVMNLVINAAESVPEGQTGAVQVSVFPRSLEDSNSTLPPGEYVVLKVADTGAGMNEQTVARIFDPFFTTKFTGRGLGLAAVQGIVRSHKGTIEVRSVLGGGTVFELAFPMRAQPPAATVGTGSRWEGTGTVLLVDDEEIVRRSTAAALEQFGYSVVTACDGAHAIEVFARSPSDFVAVLLDMTMPVMNGQEVLPALRRLRPDVKVIVCSGYSEAEAVERFAREGLHAFIQKPYSGSELAEKIRDVIGA